MSARKTYRSFSQFYPFYLSQHSDPVCRVLHYVGTSIGLVTIIYAIVTARYWLLVVGIIAGYIFAWIGHFFFEKNRPATFAYPVWSFIGDWVMLKDFISGRLPKVHPALAKPRVTEIESSKTAHPE